MDIFMIGRKSTKSKVKPKILGQGNFLAKSQNLFTKVEGVKSDSVS